MATLVRSKRAGAKRGSGPLRTFDNNTLETDFLRYCQLSMQPELFPVNSQRVRQLRNEAQQYIGCELFHSEVAEREILGQTLLEVPQIQDGKTGKTPNLPAHLASLCERSLLTPEQERNQFQRMNFLRFKAGSIAASWDGAESICQWDIERVSGLLRAANWYRDNIVQANLRLVISIVKKFVNTQCSFDDLLSEGIVALMRAVEKFDSERGFRFSTYATQVVRRCSYRSVMDRQEERLKVTTSIHEPGLDVAAGSSGSVVDEVRWSTTRNHLTTLLNFLDRREKFIIRARFSLGGHRRVQTLQRLADSLGVSKERIRQLEKRAMDKLKALAAEHPLEVVEKE